MLRNERGIALPLVIMIATVLIILGVSLISVSANGMKREDYQEKKLQAYYLAKSGANAIADYIIKTYNYQTIQTDMATLNSQIKNVNVRLDPLDSTRTFNVEVKPDPVSGTTQKLQIISTGKVNNVQEKTTLILEMTTGFSFGSETVVVANKITGNGNTKVIGDVATNLSNSVYTFDPKVVQDPTPAYDAKRTYPEGEYPSYLDANCKWSLPADNAPKVSGCYKDLKKMLITS
ncbi:hypothetical protein [Paenibacillus albus]|uniref:Type 4 fimbrial biogenesis protein PilX N-terminal domain-containing protein n=1 Tax=Paenibacillus albus TaxID=2495582 RepID=A0A3S9AC51_9BACL|nr:hypothetical protein [Paenibacillus albus]AZN43347.1 hypothetical protein EJC50_29395 [Paenibacillus albus]